MANQTNMETPTMTRTVNRTSLPWKVHNETGALVGATAAAEDAAILLGSLPDGSHVKADERAVYVKGPDGNPAESFDAAAETMRTRRSANARALETTREARKVAATIRGSVPTPAPAAAPQ